MNASVNEMKEQLPLAVDHAMKTTHSMFESIEKPVEEAYHKVKDKTIEAYDSSIQVVRQNPVTSVAIALGVGALAGYFLKRH